MFVVEKLYQNVAYNGKNEPKILIKT